MEREQGITRMCSRLPEETQSAHSSVSEREETGGYLGLQERVNRTRQDVETNREDENTEVKRKVDTKRTIRTNNDAHNLETEIANLFLWGGGPPLLNTVDASRHPMSLTLGDADRVASGTTTNKQRPFSLHDSQ